MLSMSTGVFHDVSYAYLSSVQNNWDPVLATHSRTLHNMPYLSMSVVIADDEEVRHSVPIVEVNRLVVVYPSPRCIQALTPAQSILEFHIAATRSPCFRFPGLQVNLS